MDDNFGSVGLADLSNAFFESHEMMKQLVQVRAIISSVRIKLKWE